MKKFLSICISLTLLMALVSCGDSSPSKNESPTEQEFSTPVDQIPDTEQSSNSTDSLSADDRGIPGMKSFALLAVLTGEPFGIPMGDNNPTDAENTSSAYTCVSNGGGEGSGIMYDYSLSLDSDKEIIGASFGVMSTTASERELLTAADLYFYAISLIEYDTADSETLAAWFSDNLPNAGSEAIETTIGDAVFQLYGISGVMYWVDISKT